MGTVHIGIIGHTSISQNARTMSAECNRAWRRHPAPEAQLTPTRRITAMANNMEAVALLILSGVHLGSKAAQGLDLLIHRNHRS